MDENMDNIKENMFGSDMPLDFGQIEKIMGMVKLFKTLNDSNIMGGGLFNNGNPLSENTSNNAVVPEIKNEVINNVSEQETAIKKYSMPFDEDLQTPTIRTIKAAIPYLDFKYQRNMGVLVKLIEMDRLIHKYSNMTVSGQNVDGNWQKGMLQAIKPELDKKNQQVVDMFMKMIEIKDIAEGLENGK